MLKTKVYFLVDLNKAAKAKLLRVPIFIISNLKQKPYFSPPKNMILSWPTVREALSYYPALWQRCEYSAKIY